MFRFQFPQLRVRYIVKAANDFITAAVFQFPQLRVRYIGRFCGNNQRWLFQFPQLRVRYISQALYSPSIPRFQFPQLRVRYILPPCGIPDREGVSIPAAAGKIHNLRVVDGSKSSIVSIPAAAGKIHRKNNESTLHICGTICAAFCLCLLYYRGSLKPCLPFAQKAKRNFPVFVFSRVRSPVL